jgi:beta-lactamase class A
LSGAQVSARAVDLGSGAELLSVDDHVVMPTAAVGKVLLLVEVAARMKSEPESALELQDRLEGDVAHGAGVWQYLRAPQLPVADLAVLVGASGDNLATNVLLRRVGLQSVTERARSLGFKDTALLDLARDHRGPDDAPQLSVGSAIELTRLFSSLANGGIISPAVSRRVVSWLSLGADLSMVAAAFGLDPLSHRRGDHELTLVNKTGADPGVRCDVGVLRGPSAGVAYAVSTTFDDADLATRLAVLDGMRTVGLDILEYVHSA